VTNRDRIDWRNLGPLPIRRRPDGWAEAQKLAACHARRAKGPKNHATNRERSRAERRRAAESERRLLERDATGRAYRAAVRAFWRGERPDHPGPPPPR
jgi:hypothetical protein